MDFKSIYENRFSERDRQEMNEVWRVLTRHYFQKWVKETDDVLDVGAGFCHFINNIRAGRKFAYDVYPEVTQFCESDVTFLTGPDIDAVLADTIFDVIFLSNVLAHLENMDAVVRMLVSLRRHLRENGRLVILAPNYRLIGRRYFDLLDLRVVLTDRSITEALGIAGFRLDYIKRRFLPFTSRSRMPRAPWLVRLYLMLPPVHLVMGKQSVLIARPAESAVDYGSESD